jgi:acyl-coenzyme A synthetase/AMP-(fatty) acid ligase
MSMVLIQLFGHVQVMSRTDDIINVADHRLSMGALEDVLASHLDVAERVVAGWQATSAVSFRWDEGTIIGATATAGPTETEQAQGSREEISCAISSKSASGT